MKRRCRAWTDKDTARTIDMLASGMSLNAIGKVLNRSHHTVRANMAKVPGYVSRGRGRPKGNKCKPIIMGEKAESGWCPSLSTKMLSVSLRV